METRKKRVLVVDDSASARLTLQRMLEAHGLIVDLAISAEDALDYLGEARPDVIFMDHMMPGMDGLQAVKTIKDDPTTAMIPIMMYTSKGGEVYVGQARALGAVGVLSKDVKPVELLKVLRALRMVDDPDDPNASGIRRARATFVERRDPAVPDEGLKEAVKEAVVSCEGDALRRTLLPLLQEQRVQFKRELAGATETLLKRMGAMAQAAQSVGQEARQGRRARWSGWLLAGLLMAVVVLDHLPGGAQAPPAQTVVPPAPRAQASIPELVAGAQDTTQGPAVAERTALYELLGWALGHAGAYPYPEQPLGPHTLGLLQGLVSRLAAIGFQGTIRLDTHLGRFCLARDAQGLRVLPRADVSMGECDLDSLDPGEARLRGGQQSLAFANFLDSAPELAGGEIRIELVSHGLDSPRLQPPGPDAVQSAGEWNRIAALNNRVEFSVIPQGR